MATIGTKTLALFVLAGTLTAFADDAGKAATKTYAHGAGKGAGKPPSAKPAAPGPGRMQVEEPGSSASVPDAKASKAWQKSHARGLTEEQKRAFRERKEKMEGMIAVIQAKRKAMQDAKPEERAALARDLHRLILENPDPNAVTAAARVEGPKEDMAAAKAEAAKAEAATQAQRREELRRQQLERMKSWKQGEDGD